MSRIKSILIICVLSSTMLMAELPYTFNKIAHYENQEYSSKIAVLNDSLVFVAGGSRGLCAYKYTGYSLNFINSINSGIQVVEVAVNNNGIIFATAADGLSAYSFNGSEFTLIDNLPDEGGIGMAADTNNTVFCAQYSYGLKAYVLNSDSLLLQSSYYTNDYDLDHHGFDVSIGVNGKIFLADDFGAICAFNWNGSNLSFINRLSQGFYDAGFMYLDANLNNYVLASSSLTGGMYLYHFNGSSFIRIDHIPLRTGCIKSGGNSLFYVGGGGYLEAYTFNDTSINLIAQIISDVKDVAVGSDSTIFCAREENGICAYKFNGVDFKLTAETSGLGIPVDVKIYNENTILVVSGEAGMIACSYDGNSLGFITNIGSGEYANDIEIGKDNTIFLANRGAGIQAFKYLDSEFILQDYDDSIRAINIEISDNNTIYVSESHGINAYTYSDGAFNKNFQETFSYSIRDIAIYGEDTLCIAGSSDGFFVYSVEDSMFTLIDSIQGGSAITSVEVDKDKNIIVGDINDELTFLKFESSVLTIIDKDTVGWNFEWSSKYGGSIQDIEISSNNTIYIADYEDGLWVYIFKESTLTPIAHINEYLAGDSDGIGLINDSTLIAANGNNGLDIYKLVPYVESHIQDEDDLLIPKTVSLNQNYPNPFNPITTISYEIKDDSYSKLIVYDIFGQLIETLADGYHQAGAYSVKWNAGNYSSGIYIYRLEYGDKHISRKMLLIK